MEFEIKETGFYLTREGILQKVVAILEGFEFSVIAINADGEPNNWRCNGSYLGGERVLENKLDLVRYLPTVKSWNDPIPPPEPPAVTVYTEWLSVGEDGNRWTGWTMDGAKPCYAVAKLRTVEVSANE
jgi:hypothetical protein